MTRSLPDGSGEDDPSTRQRTDRLETAYRRAYDGFDSSSSRNPATHPRIAMLASSWSMNLFALGSFEATSRRAERENDRDGGSPASKRSADHG